MQKVPRRKVLYKFLIRCRRHKMLGGDFPNTVEAINRFAGCNPDRTAIPLSAVAREIGCTKEIVASIVQDTNYVTFFRNQGIGFDFTK